MTKSSKIIWQDTENTGNIVSLGFIEGAKKYEIMHRFIKITGKSFPEGDVYSVYDCTLMCVVSGMFLLSIEEAKLKAESLS